MAWYFPSSKTTLPVVSLNAGNGQPLIRLSDYAALHAECEKLRKGVERYRHMLEEPVGYVSPRLLDTLRSCKACGITMEDKPDAHNGVTVPLYTAEQQPDIQASIVCYRRKYGVLVKDLELLLRRLEKMPRKLWLKEQLETILTTLALEDEKDPSCDDQ